MRSPGRAPRTPSVTGRRQDASELYEVARWGKGYFSVGAEGHLLVHPTKDPSRALDLKQLVDHLQLRGIGLPTLIRFSDILKHRLRDIAEAFQSAISAAQLQRQIRLRLPDQGEPAASGRRRSPEVRAALFVRARGRLEAGAAGGRGHRRQRHADHLQRLQGRRVHRDGDAGPEDRAAHHSGGREIHRAGADPRDRRAGRRAADDRHAREAGGARRRALAVVRRLPLEVRADGRRDHPRPRRAEVARHGRLLPAAPLPPRQPDPQHPHRQGRVQRGGARLRRARQAGRRPEIHGRRRRPRRRLRRLADQFRIEHQLHARGIRQRRRLSPADGVRRSGRVASDDHLGERPRGGGVSQHAGVQRAGRVRLRRRAHSDGADRRHGAAAHRSHRHVSQHVDEERAGELPRRAAGPGHGDQPVLGRLPVAEPALPG